MVYIVGLGPGHRDYILPKATDVMEKCDVIVGFKRAVESLDFVNTKKHCVSRLMEIKEYIADNSDKNIAVAASGDPTFYGITNYLKNTCKFNVTVIPGISSFQYLTSKVGLNWNNAHLGSLHGREEEFLKEVKNNEVSIWLTDKINNPAVLCGMLDKEKINCSVIIGENLSYDDEVIVRGTPGEFMSKQFSDLSLLIVEK